MIWHHVLGQQRIRIINKHQRLGHTICDAHYWQQHHASRPDLRASSYMYTYGSLPATKKLADINLCDMMVACRQMYEEITPLLYSVSTFAFFDLRTVRVFKSGILPEHWGSIRYVEIYAAFYRKDDMKDAVEARSQLQLEAWPQTCTALRSLPSLRKVTIFVGNVRYLDASYLRGGKKLDLHKVASKLLMMCKVKGEGEAVFASTKPGGGENGTQKWDLLGLTEEDLEKLEQEQRH